MGAHVSVPMYWRTIPQRFRLEGRRCRDCRSVVFPLRAACPACSGREFDVVELRGTGSIHALTTIVGAGAPPEFANQAERASGYSVAIVALDEGPMITGQLVASREEPRIGARVKAVTRLLYSEEGVVRYGFKFLLDGTS